MVQPQGGWCWLRATPMLTGISVGQSAVKGTCQWSVLCWGGIPSNQQLKTSHAFSDYLLIFSNTHILPETNISLSAQRLACEGLFSLIEIKWTIITREKGLLLKGDAFRRDGETDGSRVMAKSVGCPASSMTAQPQETMCEAQQQRMNDGAHIWRLSACTYNKSQLDAYDRL